MIFLGEDIVHRILVFEVDEAESSAILSSWVAYNIGVFDSPKLLEVIVEVISVGLFVEVSDK